MTEFDSLAAVRESTAAQLAEMMKLDAAAPGLWQEQDLPAMLRHQFAAPLEFDLSIMELESRQSLRRDKTLTGAANSRIGTFRDLLFHRTPPLALLKLAKEFFKWRSQDCQKDSPEWKIAYLFYLLSLLAAGEHAAKLSRLSPKDLRKGAEWALAQKWIDEPTRRLLLSARQRLLA